MRVLQFNIFNGCQNDPARLERLGDWLKTQAYDVVGLNELNGWDQAPGIVARANAWGYPHAELNVTRRSRFFVGVLSRHPVTVVEKREAGFCHGALQVRIRGVHFLITHLTPISAADREKEAAIIADMVRGIQDPLVLMGDLNTLSPLDCGLYEAQDLLKVLLGDALLRRKFVNDRGEVNYAPMQRLLDAGLTDLGAMGADRHTVPTAVNTDKMHAARMRLDYMLANAAFAKLATPVRALHGDAVDRLSDHYPIECSLARPIHERR